MNTVFVVQHLHQLPNGEDSAMFIGVYRTMQLAEEAVKRLSTQPGFSKHPYIVDCMEDDDDQGFHITEYELDKDHWTEGFATMIGYEEVEE